MALIDCPECGKQVSSKAPTCPNCGAPIATVPVASTSTPPRASAPEVQTIEQTSKIWKALQVFGVLLMLGSCAKGCGSINPPPGVNASPGDETWAAWWVGGFFLLVFARTMAWWKHG